MRIRGKLGGINPRSSLSRPGVLPDRHPALTVGGKGRPAPIPSGAAKNCVGESVGWPGRVKAPADDEVGGGCAAAGLSPNDHELQPIRRYRRRRLDAAKSLTR